MNIINMCPCCLLRPPDNDLMTPYIPISPSKTIPEVYLDMLEKCFGIRVKCSNDHECGICNECMNRLQDSNNFKLQVQHCQVELRKRLAVARQAQDEEPEVKLESGHANDHEKESIPYIKKEDELEFKKEEHEELSNNSLFAELDNRHCNVEIPAVALQTFSNDFTHPRISTEDAAVFKRNIDNLYETCTEPAQYNKQCIANTTKKVHNKLSTNQPYKCEVCKETFTSKYFANKHFKLCHGIEKPHICAICNKLFSSKQYLKKHKFLHKKRKPYCCEICKKRFAHISTLNAHKLTHVAKMKYYCEICGQQCQSMSALNAHIRIHTGEKPYECDTCRKRFKIKGDLKGHIMAIHMRLKPYSCGVCGRKFSFLCKLRRHELIHKEDRPKYACEICNKQFRYKHKLPAHRLIHTGEKPHRCEICGKHFRARYNLKTHLKNHVKG